MKKLCVCVTVFLFLAAAGIFGDESNLYARTIQIEKVYPHQLGYKVTYLTGKLTYGTTFLPHKWFTHASSTEGKKAKGEVAWGDGAMYPYMIVFWRDGKFSHVRLFLRRNMDDVSYGVISPQQDPASFDIEEIALEF